MSSHRRFGEISVPSVLKAEQEDMVLEREEQLRTVIFRPERNRLKWMNFPKEIPGASSLDLSNCDHDDQRATTGNCKTTAPLVPQISATYRSSSLRSCSLDSFTSSKLASAFSWGHDRPGQHRDEQRRLI